MRVKVKNLLQRADRTRVGEREIEPRDEEVVVVSNMGVAFLTVFFFFFVRLS